MAESETEITREQLQKEISEILDKSSLENTSTKKVIQKLESKLGVDLTAKKKLIDQLVMEYVNDLDSEEEEMPRPKQIKKEQEDEDDEDIHDDSNDSDWGCRHGLHDLEQYSEDGTHAVAQETVAAAVAASEMRRHRHRLRSIAHKRASSRRHEEDESEIFGKLTARMLRKLSGKQRNYMMVKINQLFYSKCHEKKGPSKRQMLNKATATLPTIHCDAKKLYRLESINLPPEGPVNFSVVNYPYTTNTARSNEPGPTNQQVAFAVEIPINKVASPNNENAANVTFENNDNTSCAIM